MQHSCVLNLVIFLCPYFLRCRIELFPSKLNQLCKFRLWILIRYEKIWFYDVERRSWRLQINFDPEKCNMHTFGLIKNEFSKVGIVELLKKSIRTKSTLLLWMVRKKRRNFSKRYRVCDSIWPNKPVVKKKTIHTVERFYWLADWQAAISDA